MSDTMTITTPTRSVPWVVLLGAALVAASALLLLAAPVGYITGTVPLGTALLRVFAWGAYAGAAAAVVSLAGLILILRRPGGARRGLALAALSFVLGLALIGVPARFLIGKPKPRSTTSPPIRRIRRSMSPSCRCGRTRQTPRSMAARRSRCCSAPHILTFSHTS